MISDFLSLLFPKVCIICEEPSMKGEAEICVNCQHRLPKTDYHLKIPNELDQRFWGRANIAQSMAFLNFTKGGTAQQLLYKIKYRQKKNAAALIGRWYGYELKEAGLNFDLIVPVPLHRRKLKLRGYNQSEYFAAGLSEAMMVGYKNILERTLPKSTQTNKSRFLRWENVAGIYKIKPGENPENLHVLLVDDVVTTGATAEVCAQALLDAGARKISFAAMASAS